MATTRAAAPAASGQAVKSPADAHSAADAPSPAVTARRRDSGGPARRLEGALVALAPSRAVTAGWPGRRGLLTLLFETARTPPLKIDAADAATWTHHRQSSPPAKGELLVVWA